MNTEPFHTREQTISIVLAAGRGSRMNGYTGSKVLLPLKPERSMYEGSYPIIERIIENLPDGPKALVVNHCKQAVIEATRRWGVHYCDQPILNGTGGALLSAAPFLRAQIGEAVIITMGDAPFVRADTYRQMIDALEGHDMVVLGFAPEQKKQYGLLEIEDHQVLRIIEWKYWRYFDAELLSNIPICNAGIYAVRKDVLERYFAVIANRPHTIQKIFQGRMATFEEYFLTDLVELMYLDNRPVGYILAADEQETMGIDDPESLERAQAIYRKKMNLR